MQVDDVKERWHLQQQRSVLRRDQLAQRVIRGCLLHGRDKLLALLALKKKTSVRLGFARWHMIAVVTKKVMGVKKQRAELQVTASCTRARMQTLLSCSSREVVLCRY